MPKRRNAKRFTPQEIQTATLINTEGTIGCYRAKTARAKTYYYRYPRIAIRMCAKDALKPAEKVFGRKITRTTSKNVMCPPELFPPNGKGIWVIDVTAKKAKQIYTQLEPLLTNERRKQWEETIKHCPV